MATADSTVENQHSHETDTQACIRLFGEHPEDVVGTINCAADTLFQLEAIFNVIAKQAADAECRSIRRLAQAGAYLAFDMGNLADCRREELAHRLHQARTEGSPTA